MDINILFLEDCDPQDGSKIFKKDTAAKLNPASARHWTRRGKAVEISARQARDINAKAKADAKAQAEAEAEAEAQAKQAEKDKKAAQKKAEKEAAAKQAAEKK